MLIAVTGVMLLALHLGAPWPEQLPKGRGPNVGILQDASLIESSTCTFRFLRLDRSETVLASDHLGCEVWANLDGADVRIPISDTQKSAACTEDWDRPAKTPRFVITYLTGTTKLVADYWVSDLCWVTGGCDSKGLNATLTFMDPSGSSSVKVRGRCSG
ncbi:MAG: hypothetical protein HY661_06245 [Betaproteobacteria bacterium]|nr:hypothetical protein [Betaproteobacteria bacterium]